MPIPLLPPLGGGPVIPTVTLGSVESEEDVPGVLGPPSYTGPVLLGSVESAERVPGVYLPDPTPPEPPLIPEGEVTVQRQLQVYIDGDRLLMPNNVSCQPQANNAGTASFGLQLSDPQSVIATESLVTYKLRGRRIYVGLARDLQRVQIATGEAENQTITVQAPGLLSEWADWRVLPDFGSANPTRIGPPLQETRFFDWSHNGLEDTGWRKVTGSIDPLNGLPNETFPLPDQWPDPAAQWMWGTNPAAPAPRGVCYFRVAFTVPAGFTRAQLWLTAFDKGELWLDGVQMLTSNQRGVAQRLDVTFDSHLFHLLAIRGENIDGFGGVLASVMPVTDFGTYGPPLMNSRNGWKMLAYPTKPTRATPGRIIHELLREAKARGCAKSNGWVLSFDDHHDSAGRPWPIPDGVSIPVGTDYLSVLNQLATDLIDFTCAQGNRILHAWVKGTGTGADQPIPFTPGVDFASLTDSRTA